MLLLRESDVRALLPMADAIDLMDRALRAFSTGQVVQPVRLAMLIGPHGGYLGLMPAHLRAPEEALGAKAVTFYPGNAARGLPTHLAVILLWEGATGQPLALLDGRLITEVRTAATSAAAARVLARPQAAVLAILGAGVQARSHLEALRLVRPIREVRVWSRTSARAAALAEEAREKLGVAARACATAEEAVRGADLIVTATSSPTPVLAGAWVAPGAHITSVGAARPDWRELDTEAVRRARVFVDSRAGALAESGDLLIPMREGALSADHIAGEVGEVLAGRVPGRTADEEITLFKSLGMAVEDVAAAHLVYTRARQRGVGEEISL
ncbi:MAG: ornithine cyclodeaminase family protein [Armatimonadota bacterium]|nr:ornithine cyclodeaminase family protein [Armatimonadota bacterium]MDR7402579.1 ornithine cyclodeaminase family protein [Armatimonadota bacterium]MDR7404054.1 ornithine cyclodeaminase family protein [Armatimonadota bacterium]MDR7436819.1 ornithine cyclodeaminase family protein [Armatimonadota bacterium]MDR7472766.1 ornithine cyclodeaminase family protein [Armatimonadota bacterium]